MTNKTRPFKVKRNRMRVRQSKSRLGDHPQTVSRMFRIFKNMCFILLNSKANISCTLFAPHLLALNKDQRNQAAYFVSHRQITELP